MEQRALGFPVVGWREWVGLSGLGIPHIKAKIDTGARTSALHAFYIDPFTRNDRQWVGFGVHPFQGDNCEVIDCEAPVVDFRRVMDSGGHSEERYVIETEVCLGRLSWSIELTLSNRDNMRFRMLIGRTALSGRYLVDSSASYLMGKFKRKRGGKHENRAIIT